MSMVCYQTVPVPLEGSMPIVVLPVGLPARMTDCNAMELTWV